jgi:hypothetical protein
MNRRAIIFLAASAFLTGAVQFSPVAAQKAGNWDGTWSGSWSGPRVPVNRGATSVTIIGGRIARYEYMGRPVPVTISKVERSIVTFGIAGNYAIRITRTGPNTATATYENLGSNEAGDVAAADLTRN